MRDETTRDRLLDAARGLLWARGYDATSPKAIMEESGTGQGSFYHFFEGKQELAATALEQIADDLIADLATIFDAKRPGLDRVRAWLEMPRRGLVGCRLGRLAMENSVVEEDRLRTPIMRYFKAAERALRSALRDAQRERTLARGVDADDVAVTLLAIVQGGYVLSRSMRDADKLRDAVRGAVHLLEASRA